MTQTSGSETSGSEISGSDAPVQQALAAGPPLFVTVSNLRVNPSASAFVVTFDSDQAFQAAVNWTADTDAPSPGGGPLTGIANEAGPTTRHSITVAPAQAAAGKTYTFYIQLAAADSSGLLIRPYALDGFVQLVGARAAANQTVPVRFYAFGGTPPAPAGGTGGQGGGTGNWNQYTWAQYNPKRTTYPTP